MRRLSFLLMVLIFASTFCLFADWKVGDYVDEFGDKTGRQREMVITERRG